VTQNFYQDGNRKPGQYYSFQSASTSIGSLGGAMQGDLYQWGNDDGAAMYTIGTLDAGVATAQIQPTSGSASPLGFCGNQFLPAPADLHLSRRFGALGLSPTTARVGDSMWIYGDANGDAGGTASYEFSGTQWVRAYPTPLTPVIQINLLSPDTGVSYTRSGKDPLTRIGFSSFWND
jgi:hypothetical protein